VYLPGECLSYTIPDTFVAHNNMQSQIKNFGLDSEINFSEYKCYLITSLQKIWSCSRAIPHKKVIKAKEKKIKYRHDKPNNFR